MYSQAEENYLKCIYALELEHGEEISTNLIASKIKTKASSVTDMLKKLSAKDLVVYKKYQGVKLTERGRETALRVVRKHRLWECFLVQKLDFKWDEVHEIAEQLEHIVSPLLISRLDEFLDFPKIDPHGDPIPNEHGEITVGPQFPLIELDLQTLAVLTAVENTESLFLKHLDNLGIRLGIKFQILERAEFDGSLMMRLENNQEIFVSKEVASNLLVRNL